jgi:hypothetical protein
VPGDCHPERKLGRREEKGGKGRRREEKGGEGRRREEKERCPKFRNPVEEIR